MTAYVGTSGWSFKEWKGSFYPKDLPDDQMLTSYASRLGAVEVNNTFYRMPKEKVLLEWAQAVPEGFRFAVKASQRITHHARLRDVGDNLQYFLRVCTALGDRRGPSLFQLPPNLKADLPLLQDFLALLPHGWRATMEFRHPTWFTDGVYEALRKHNVALTVAEQDDFETPVVATATWGYLRLHRASYDAARLSLWAERIRGQPWEEAFVFFKHEGEGSGPEIAVQFAADLGPHQGASAGA
jgi:uncharacterized protein YecE (DUF72 family)